jgi:Arc/MetJ-type ribon-helix-helix transcriptional regulator
MGRKKNKNPSEPVSISLTKRQKEIIKIMVESGWANTLSEVINKIVTFWLSEHDYLEPQNKQNGERDGKQK